MSTYFLLAAPEGYVLMANSIYGNRVAFLFTSLSGSLLVISLSVLIDRLKTWQKLLPYLGTSTLGIFILHKPVVELLRKVVTKLGYSYNNPLWLLLITLLTLCIVMPVLYLMQRYLPFLFGNFKIERKHKA